MFLRDVLLLCSNVLGHLVQNCIFATQTKPESRKNLTHLLIVTQQGLDREDAFHNNGLNLLPEPRKAEASLLHPPSAVMMLCHWLAFHNLMS